MTGEIKHYEGTAAQPLLCCPGQCNRKILPRAWSKGSVAMAELCCGGWQEFFKEYLKPECASKQQLLYVMNPTKFMACEFLIRYHEQTRGDKVRPLHDPLHCADTVQAHN